MCDDHVSLYQLTLERGTPLYKDVKLGKMVRVKFLKHMKSNFL